MRLFHGYSLSIIFTSETHLYMTHRIALCGNMLYDAGYGF